MSESKTQFLHEVEKRNVYFFLLVGRSIQIPTQRLLPDTIPDNHIYSVNLAKLSRKALMSQQV